MGYKIAIDGPAGAGKSTVAKAVAKKLGYLYVDTGAMYRALALHFLNSGLSSEDTRGLIKACATADVNISYECGIQHVFLNGTDVTGRIRAENVGEMASAASAIPEVRSKLLQLQRQIAEKEDVVMEGRDIGTKILPDADLKIYLTAEPLVRARRRFDELAAKGTDCDLEEIKREMELRDRRDKSRAQSPLRQAKDAVLLDNSRMTIDKTADEILRVYGGRVKYR